MKHGVLHGRCGGDRVHDLLRRFGDPLLHGTDALHEAQRFVFDQWLPDTARLMPAPAVMPNRIPGQSAR
jgi:hypothetical protein